METCRPSSHGPAHPLEPDRSLLFFTRPRPAYTHWGMYNIPGDSTGLPENAGAPGSPFGTQVVNDGMDAHYDGPCPPPNVHHYVFTVYALSAELTLPSRKLPRQGGEHPVSSAYRSGTGGSHFGKRQARWSIFDDPAVKLGLLAPAITPARPWLVPRVPQPL